MSTSQSLIQQYLPENLHQKAVMFTIPDDFLTNHADVVSLILESKSMDKDEEKQNWFNLFPLMNEEQMNKLKDILTREKQKLSEIEEKYDKKKQDIKEKYVQKWEDSAYLQKIQTIKATEQSHQEKEQQEAEDLLSKI